MATFRRVTGFLLRKVSETSFVGRSSGLFLCRNCTINGKITAFQGQIRTNSTKNDQIRKDEPIAYSKSPARHHKVNDTLKYDSSKLNSYRTLIICFGLFSFIIYYGFIREESEAEQKIFEFNEMQESPVLQSNQQTAGHSEILKK
ncbi:Hypothetical predicted protein [Paramuricea clavata]|uniref:Uncharacterized protein n=1 Tax=Paramuricea clavata TaxID=317549 RepID=A0A7D9EJ17_PARCT|nr:Hypothetical predicted protein [Paramuricea clavata]